MKTSTNKKARLFDLLVDFEMNIDGLSGHYNISDYTLSQFLSDNKIIIKDINEKYKRNKGENIMHISGHTRDKAFSIMKHIRNAIAHGNFNISHKNNIELHDINNHTKTKKETFYSFISFNLLFDLFETIKQTYI